MEFTPTLSANSKRGDRVSSWWPAINYKVLLLFEFYKVEKE
jgi:hypothetical protein